MNISFLFHNGVRIVLVHRLRKRGVAMVCYAVLLAFVSIIGAAYLQGGLDTATNEVINRVVALLGGKRNLLENMVLSDHSWHDGNLKSVNRNANRLHTDIFSIEPNTTYEIQVDLNKISLNNGDAFRLGFITADDAGKGKEDAKGIDSEWILPTENVSNKKYTTEYDSETGIAKITFTSKADNTKFAMNFKSVNQSDTATNSINTTANINDQIKNAITMTRK